MLIEHTYNIKYIKIILYLATTGFILLSACGTQGNAGGSVESDSSKVLASIGDVMITEQMINDELNLIHPNQRQSFETPEGRRTLLIHVVEREMLLLAANDLGLENDSFVIAQVETARENALIQTYYQQEVVDAVVIPEEDILAFYNDHTGDLYYQNPLEDVRESIEDILKPELVNAYFIEVLLPSLRERYQVEIMEYTILPYETMSADSLLLSAQNLFESDPVSAIVYFKLFIDRFPNHEKAHQVQFLIGFTFSEQLGDYESAREAFQKLIDDYPESNFIEDAQWMIEYIGNDDLDKPEQPNEEYSVSVSDVWYALEIIQIFPDGIELSNWIYPLAEISCLPQDITDFNISVNEGSSFGEGVLEVSGTLSFDPILEPFSVLDGANGEKFMMNFDAFLIAPNNEILWSQSGYPRGGNAWVSAEGGSIEFTLIGSNTESINGNRILIIASGDPIESPDSEETRVIIGVGEQEL